MNGRLSFRPLGRFARGVVKRCVVRLPGDANGVPGVLGALVRLSPPDEIAAREEQGTPPARVETNLEPNHRFLLARDYAACTRRYGLAASDTTSPRVETASDAIVRAAWEDHVAPYRWAWFFLLVTGGPGRYPGRPSTSRDGGSYFARPAQCLRKAREHREVGVQFDASESTDAERCEAVLVLEPSELALHGGAAPVESPELLRAPGSANCAGAIFFVIVPRILRGTSDGVGRV